VTAVLVRLDKPVVPGAPGTLTLDLTDDEADGLVCIRCGRQEGPMVPVGWTVDRDAPNQCALFAHDECPPRPRP